MYAGGVPNGELLKGEKELAERGKPSDWAEELLEAMDRWAIKEGMEPVSEQVRADAPGSEPGLEAIARVFPRGAQDPLRGYDIHYLCQR